MADRFPLIANSSTNQIQEIPSGDNLDLSGNGIVNGGDIAVNNITGAAATFTGVLTYEDVTSVDSLGIVTARTGVRVSAGGVTVTAGGLDVVAGGADLGGQLKEKVNITAGKLSANTNINLENGMVHYFTTAETATSTPNIMTSTGINTDMATGDTIAVTIISAAGGTDYYSGRISIDGTLAGITTSWVGGSAPSAGGASGLDIYAYNIIKTGSAAYTVIGNLTNAA